MTKGENMKDFKKYLDETQEIGFVEEVKQYLIYANGLPGAMPHEMIVFESGELGQVMSLAQKLVEILVFSDSPIKVGTRVTRTNHFLEIPVSEDLLGKTIDPLGKSINSIKLSKKTSEKRPIDVTPSGIQKRQRITKPLETGVTMVDLIIPLGRGQRELVIGDRKSGKTNFIVHTVLNQAREGHICIYTGIGKKKIDVKKVEEFFQKNGVMKNIIIVASSPEDPSSIIHLTPYTAMTIAEYFRDKGRDTLIVLDDLSTHAKFYREISLIAKRFPGRNSYPGDIFHIHSKLLERAGNFIHEKGEVSITCLPVVETTQGDLSGYIQTNIMSMTDGHIFFDNDLFSKGRRPAINPFLSVTRVGHQAQGQLRREINRELISFLTLFEKVQNYVHFGAELSESIKATLSTGEQIMNLFDQPLYRTNPPNFQVFLFCTLWTGFWSQKSLAEMRQDIEKLTTAFDKDKELQKTINEFVEKYDSFNKLLGEIRPVTEKVFAAASGEKPKTEDDKENVEFSVERIPVAGGGMEELIGRK